MAPPTLWNRITKFVEHPIDSLESAYRAVSLDAEIIVGTPGENAEAVSYALEHQRLNSLFGIGGGASGVMSDYLEMRRSQIDRRMAAPLVHGLTAGLPSLSRSAAGRLLNLERGAEVCAVPPDCSAMSHPECEPSAEILFHQDVLDSFRDLPPEERMEALAELRREISGRGAEEREAIVADTMRRVREESHAHRSEWVRPETGR